LARPYIWSLRVFSRSICPSICPLLQAGVTAARTALLLAVHDTGLAGRLQPPDLLGIGLALMNGDTGRQAQAALHERLRSVA